MNKVFIAILLQLVIVNSVFCSIESKKMLGNNANGDLVTLTPSSDPKELRWNAVRSLKYAGLSDIQIESLFSELDKKMNKDNIPNYFSFEKLEESLKIGKFIAYGLTFEDFVACEDLNASMPWEKKLCNKEQVYRCKVLGAPLDKIVGYEYTSDRIEDDEKVVDYYYCGHLLIDRWSSISILVSCLSQMGYQKQQIKAVLNREFEEKNKSVRFFLESNKYIPYKRVLEILRKEGYKIEIVQGKIESVFKDEDEYDRFRGDSRL